MTGCRLKMLVCSIASCEKEFVFIVDLIKHCKQHIRNGYSIQCPFQYCSKLYKNVSSFSSHISRCHNQAVADHRICIIEGDSTAEMDTTPHLLSENVEQAVATALDSSDDTGNSQARRKTIHSKNFLKQMILFSFLLQFKYFIPATSVELLLKKVKEILMCYCDHTLKSLQSILTLCNLSENEISFIFHHIRSEDNILQLFQDGPLRSLYAREKYFKKNFLFVPPVTKRLQMTEDRTEIVTNQYVPILKSLRALFHDESVKQQFMQKLPNLSEYQDFSDGLVFKQNQLFGNSRPTLQVILYQDAFEVANPIGSAKRKHTVLAVYYTLANFHHFNRSKINTFQLALLCNDKYVTDSTVNTIFQPLIDDLKVLEADGIDIGFDYRIFGSVLFITGDNLGSHMLGGFTTNFSNSSHFCRYCTITRAEFNADCSSSYQLRTPELYDAALQHAQQADTESVNQTCGVKRNCIFNALQYFHVCSPGMPPCLAHDLFEGVIQYDVILYIMEWIKLKWFTLEYLNYQIKTFKFHPHESSSRPPTIGRGVKRLPGNACENWHFLRFLPLLVLPRIQDTSNSAWKLILSLRQITEIVVSFA